MRTPLLAGLLSLGLVATQARADILFDFNDGLQGVTVTSGGTPSHEVDGAGNGFLAVADINNDDMFLVLPLGAATVDWSGYLGGTLSLDAVSLNGLEPSWPAFGLVTFTSAAGSVSYDFVPSSAPTAQWARHSVTLDAATFGPQLANVLAALQSVTINLESGNGPIEWVGVDNLAVTAVPEPQAALLAVSGLAGLAAARRLRRR